MSGALRHASLVALMGVLVILGSNEVFLRTRGASSPEDMTGRYLAAIRRGDAAAVAWLMQDGRADERAINSRIAVYRALPTGTTFGVELIDHDVAAYLKSVRIRDGTNVLDEIGMQHQGGRFGSRWRLFFPPKSAPPL